MCEISLVPTGNIIKEYLDEHGITEKELAKQFDISEKYILSVLNGNNELPTHIDKSIYVVSYAVF